MTRSSAPTDNAATYLADLTATARLTGELREVSAGLLAAGRPRSIVRRLDDAIDVLDTLTSSDGYAAIMSGPRTRSFDRGELNAAFADAPPSTNDDVSITWDGRRLDTIVPVLPGRVVTARSPTGPRP